MSADEFTHVHVPDQNMEPDDEPNEDAPECGGNCFYASACYFCGPDPD